MGSRQVDPGRLYTLGKSKDKEKNPKSKAAEKELWRKNVSGELGVVTIPHVIEYLLHLPCEFCVSCQDFCKRGFGKEDVKTYKSSMSPWV